MAKTREIKGRIKAVSNIARITKTMQMIATARFQSSHKRAVAAQPYTRKIRELVAELSAVAGSLTSAGAGLLAAPESPADRDLYLVITSNRGLCGGYNAGVLRRAASVIRSAQQQRNVQVELVGKKGQAFLRFTKIPVHRFHDQIGDRPTYEQIEPLAQQYMDDFQAGRYDSVKVISMAFDTMSSQRPQTLTLLPLAESESGAPQGATAQVDYEFSPDPAVLLGQLLPIAVKAQLFQCFNEAAVSEQIARMIAMKAATDSADKMHHALTRRFNRARQAAITTELTEIIGGAAALS